MTVSLIAKVVTKSSLHGIRGFQRKCRPFSKTKSERMTC